MADHYLSGNVSPGGGGSGTLGSPRNIEDYFTTSTYPYSAGDRFFLINTYTFVLSSTGFLATRAAGSTTSYITIVSCDGSGNVVKGTSNYAVIDGTNLIGALPIFSYNHESYYMACIHFTNGPDDGLKVNATGDRLFLKDLDFSENAADGFNTASGADFIIMRGLRAWNNTSNGMVINSTFPYQMKDIAAWNNGADEIILLSGSTSGRGMLDNVYAKCGNHTGVGISAKYANISNGTVISHETSVPTSALVDINTFGCVENVILSAQTSGVTGINAGASDELWLGGNIYHNLSTDVGAGSIQFDIESGSHDTTNPNFVSVPTDPTPQATLTGKAIRNKLVSESTSWKIPGPISPTGGGGGGGLLVNPGLNGGLNG